MTDRRRSMRFESLAPLARIPGIQWVSLQKDWPNLEQEAAAIGLQVIDPMPLVEDFQDTAGIVANLDLVITVDTSVAHLAGAMNVPVWMLSRADGCWRWMLNREDSPWYPSMRIFHQMRPLEWAPVLNAVVAALEMQRAPGS